VLEIPNLADELGKIRVGHFNRTLFLIEKLYWEDGYTSRGFEYRIGVYPLGRNNYPIVPGVCTGIICKTRK
jgi:hypothetical protein